MNLIDLQKLISEGKIDSIMSIANTAMLIKDVTDTLKQFDPNQHDVMNPTKREDTKLKNKDGAVSKIVPVGRLPLAIQKYIVDTATAYLGVPTLDLATENQIEKDYVSVYKKIWSDNKMDYKFKSMVRKTKSERKSAILIYTKPAEPEYWQGSPIREAAYKFRMRVLAESTGDKLLPIFDELGDMIAFGHGYKMANEKGENVDYFDLYTADFFYYMRQVAGVWLFSADRITYGPTVAGYANNIGKIPVIYFQQPLTDWDDVQHLISALELIISNHNDTNKKLGSPIVFAEGDVTGFPDAGETGKLLIGKNGAKVSYLTWNSAPESIKMEIENLMQFIFLLTRTPNTSFENLKGLGYFSTVALKTLFQDAHIKASQSEEIFGEGQQRLNNYLKVAISKTDSKFAAILPLEMKPKFEYFLPVNNEEMVSTLNKAVSGGLMSRDTAVRANSMVVDAEKEIELIKAEEVEASAEAAKVAARQKVGFPVN